MAKEQKPSLVDLVAKATAADLAVIDEQITARETELAEATARIGGELGSLKALRRVIDIKLHGKPQRKTRQPRKAQAPAATSHASGDAPTGLQSEIIGFITLNGPGFPEAIGRKLDRPAQAIACSVSKRPDLLKKLSDGRIALANHEED